MVRWLSGIPFEKSRRGNARGGRTSVTSRFTSGTASAEAPMMPVIAKNQYAPVTRLEAAERRNSTTAVASAVSNRMGPR